MKAVAVFPEQREIKLFEHPQPSLPTRTGVTRRMSSHGIKSVVTVE